MTDNSAAASPGFISRLWALGPVRYLTMGGLAFLFDAGLLWLLHDAIGIDLAISTATAFLLSFAVTYTLQRKFAFASDNAVAPSVARYTALVIFNTLATTHYFPGYVLKTSAFSKQLETLMGKPNIVVVCLEGPGL